ncbi:MAG: DUF167 domain-containing protein [Planctomycetaceae bacterium]|nr:DUF167 domain-containing protein [Planctomycetaceae bacterium]
MVNLVQLENGIQLPVKAQAGARVNGITGQHDGALKVSVTQAPEKLKANKALAKVIAAALRLKNSQVELSSGATSPAKMFVVSGIELSDLSRRLQAILEA